MPHANGALKLIVLLNHPSGVLPLRDEPLRLRPVFRVIMKEACWNLKSGSFREDLPVHHTVLVNISCKPLREKKTMNLHVLCDFFDQYIKCYDSDKSSKHTSLILI